MAPNIVTDLFKLPFDSEKPLRRVLTVSELTADIRILLESNYSEIWVEGEISNARVWKTGHLYFTLKDRSSQLKAVMFRSSLRSLPFKPVDGQQIIARGRIGVYEPKGDYQIVCEHLEPHGIGALQLAFDQLRNRLDKEGLFDDKRKRPLPTLPRKIGIVTSTNGAAIRDIINILKRRYPNVHIVIAPARVQGEGAAEEIISGLKALGKLEEVDVIIVTRGGGSIEDLWAFNEESVARAIISSPVPVISAVGHETDYTISDFVCDLRAPTPSTAAELVVARKDEIVAYITRLTDRLNLALRDGLRRRRAVIHQLEARPGLTGWPVGLAIHGRQVGELSHRLTQVFEMNLTEQERTNNELRLRLEALDLGRQLSQFQARLSTNLVTLVSAIRHANSNRKIKIQTAASRLTALSPLAVLGRGYAVCWSQDHAKIIRDATTVKKGQDVHVTLHYGELTCEVKKTK